MDRCIATGVNVTQNWKEGKEKDRWNYDLLLVERLEGTE